MKITTTKMSMIAAAGLLTIGVGAAYGAGQCSGGAGMKLAEAKPAQEEETVKKQTTCPVMGGEINKDLYVDAKGKRIYVCCKGCIGAVKKNPEKYIEKLAEQDVTLESAESHKEGGATCPMKTEAESRMKGKAACPITKECPQDQCPEGEKAERHEGHHKHKE